MVNKAKIIILVSQANKYTTNGSHSGSDRKNLLHRRWNENNKKYETLLEQSQQQ